MRYLQYLRYLPFVVQLVDLIRRAQREFPEKGSGQQKLAFVAERFESLVTITEQSGIISEKLAQTLRDGAITVIEILVRAMKDTGGIEPLPDDGEETDPSKAIYTTKEDAIAALSGRYIFVLEMADGTFRIWQNIGPLPGKKVWPE